MNKRTREERVLREKVLLLVLAGGFATMVPAVLAFDFVANLLTNVGLGMPEWLYGFLNLGAAISGFVVFTRIGNRWLDQRFPDAEPVKIPIPSERPSARYRR